MKVELITEIKDVLVKMSECPRFKYSNDDGLNFKNSNHMSFIENNESSLIVTYNSMIEQYTAVRKYRDHILDGGQDSLIYVKKLIPEFKLDDINTPSDFEHLNFDDYMFQQMSVQPSHVIDQLNFVNDSKDIFPGHWGSVVVYGKSNIKKLIDEINQFLIDNNEKMERTREYQIKNDNRRRR